MSKTIKITIQDEHTLVLQEDAQKGDTIDLRSIHETDIDASAITSVVNSIRTNEFNAQLKKEAQSIEREKALEAQLKEQDIITRAKEAISKKDQEIATLHSKLDTIAKQTASDVTIKALEDKQKIEESFRQRLTEKEAELSEIKHQKQLN